MFACLPSTTLKCFSGEVAKQERHIAVTMVSLGRHDKTVIYINVSSTTSFFLFLPVLAFSISLCFLFYLWLSRTSILSCLEITLTHTHTYALALVHFHKLKQRDGGGLCPGEMLKDLNHTAGTTEEIS